MKRHQSFICSVGITLLALVGCGEAPSNESLVKIAGRVTVDGDNAVGVTLTIHPVDQQGAIATGTVDELGRLSVSTFQLGDGLRPGQYRVTCLWGQFDPVSRQIKGDRLAGRYADPEKSPIEWTITRQDSQDVGEIRLTSTSQ